MWQFQNFIECLSLGGVPKILLERGDNPDVEIRGLPLFYYFTVQLQLLCVCVGGGGGSKISSITFWFFSLLSYPCKILIEIFILLKHCIICVFLIHSDSLQSTLFNLVWNTQKSKCTNFFKYQGKMFLNIENVLMS